MTLPIRAALSGLRGYFLAAALSYMGAGASVLSLTCCTQAGSGEPKAPGPTVPAGARTLTGREGATPAVTALITIDTWRADHFDAVHTPVLWRLAQSGLRYTNAWSPIGLTSPAHATMLTGLMPWEHGMRANNHHGYRLRADVPVVADRLGLPAAAFVSAYPAGPAGGLDRGFDLFDGPSSGERPGSIAVAHALSWLAEGPGASQPVFLWVHLYEPHGPYVGTGSSDPERYAQEVALADRSLAPLLDELTRRGSRIVVAADHGEVLLEETCGRQHERSSSPEVLHVPLFVWSPELSPGESDELVGLSDVPALLMAQQPAHHDAWLAESGMCEPSCALGCAPAGLEGRDRVVIGPQGDDRWISRPGVGMLAVGHPDTRLKALLSTIPAVPPPLGAAPEEAALLGYIDP